MIEQLESELRSALKARAAELPTSAGARVRARDYRPRTRDLRPPVAAGVLATAAAAAAAVLLVDLGPQAPSAFAGWTPTPTHASTAQVADAKDACQSQRSTFSTGSAKAMKAARIKDLPTISEMTPVLTDTRGPFTFVIYSGANGSNGTCISGPNFTSMSTRSGTIGGPPAGKIVASFEIHAAHASDAYSFVEGHVGAGVSAATLTLSDGSHVQTTIQDGWFVAWWPGSAQVTSAQVTTPSGTTTQQFDTRPMGNCPQPPAGSTTAGTTCAGAAVAGGKGQAAGAISMGNTAHVPPSGGTVTSAHESGAQPKAGTTVTGSSSGN